VAHQLLGEDLRALYPGGRAGRAEDLQVCLPEGFRDAPDQGRLRADDGEVDAVLLGVVPEGDQVVCGDVCYLGYGGYAGVSGGGVHLGL
jgi:hypothetical protein